MAIPLATKYGILPAIGLYLVALFLPFDTLTHENTPYFSQLQSHRGSLGLTLLAVGWLIPLCLNVAWFANVAFAVSVWRLVKFHRCSILSAIGAFALASTIFLPTLNLNVELRGYDQVKTSGPAVWAWLAALAYNMLFQLWFLRSGRSAVG